MCWFIRRWAILVLTVSVILSFGSPGGEPRRGLSSYYTSFTSSSSSSPSPSSPLSPSTSFQSGFNNKTQSQTPLEYDFYRDKCPQAEEIVRSTFRQIYSVRPKVAPALLRLVFHDCFIQGCDGSVLLDAIGSRNNSEKNALPNQTLRGFDVIEIIKSKLEEACPATVSCADILVLAGREGVYHEGGPFYPVLTGRRDSNQSYQDVAAQELPSPDDDVNKTLKSFSLKGFNARETVSLLGAHSIGTVHCRFFNDRLYNFDETGQPDPSLEPDFLGIMRTRCNWSNETTQEDLGTEPGMMMGYESPRTGFDNHYYRNLLQRRGILHADQQLMASETTATLVKEYASDDASAFRRDFARVMVKLSGLGVLSGSDGQVRLKCSQLRFLPGF